MDWDDLRIAAALARSGTYAGAAAELGLDATTVARRIARLEAAFPFPLFQATDGGRHPTAQGAKVLAHVHAITDHVAAIGAIPSEGSGIVGHVRIAATASICDTVLAPRAAEFLDAHGGLSLSILASDANVSFSRYEADIAIRMARPQRGGFVIRRLATLPLALCEPVRSDGEAEPIACAYPDSLSETPEMIEAARLGIAQKARFVSNSAAAIRTVLTSGRAVAVLPAFGRDLASLPDVNRTPLDRSREAWLLIQPHLAKDAATRAVADWIEACFAAMA
ncbi:LysR family transcriptional regulator [Oricola sp.]|uniref:LysR family transcriptional regulator n=1 Tax=Oricola sp. TaxID=1979950 RepID=UPI0025E289CD|nr:LysR family transcriptional regulator [Oricola sp.]MCI5074610.1 LysR family transcriptional regulator [Oricola sp.]